MCSDDLVEGRPCRYCGEVTHHPDGLCNNCWMVVRLLPNFLNTEDGMQFVIQQIEKVQDEDAQRRWINFMEGV